MKRENTTSVPLSLTIGIMSLFFLGMSLGSITPAMNKLTEFYGAQGIPMTTVMYVTSLPQLTSVAGSLIAGVIAGKKLPFKTCGIFGILLILIGGIAPSLVTGFAALLATRMVFGVGFGFIMVLGNPLISAFYSGDAKAKILSVSTFVSFGGAVVMQLLCGVLTDIGLNYAYLTHLVAIPPLMLVITMLKEPPKVQAGSQGKKSGPLSGRVVFIAVIFGLVTMFVMPLYINLAIFVWQANSLSTVAAVVQVLYSIGNMLGGLCFAVLYKCCKRFSMGISCLLMGSGLLIMLNASSLAPMCVAMLVSGFGYGGLMPASLMIAGQVSKPSQTALATSIVFTGMNVLGFLATPFADFIGGITGDPLSMPVATGMALIFIIGIFLLAVNPFPKKDLHS